MKLRKTLAVVKADFRDEGLEDITRRFRAHKQRFLHPARIENPVRKNMPALMIGHELHFVDGQKGKAFFDRHGFDGADIKPRLGRNDFLFTRNQRNLRRALLHHNAVINLPREQPQRQTDDARTMRQHPLNRVMGLTGIRRAENGL